MYVCIVLHSHRSLLTFALGLSYPRRCLARPLQVHPYMGHPLQLVRGGRVPLDPSPLLPGLLLTISGLLLVFHILMVEYRLQDLLHPQLDLCPVLDA